MITEFSDEFRLFVSDVVKKSSSKEKIYNYIDQLESGNIPSYFFDSFKSSIITHREFTSDDQCNFFIKFSINESNLFNYSSNFMNEIYTHIALLFQQKNQLRLYFNI